MNSSSNDLKRAPIPIRKDVADAISKTPGLELLIKAAVSTGKYIVTDEATS